MRSVILVAATFLACAVEMVEALTIVLAAAMTRGWRSVRLGIGAALVVLAGVVAVLGSALTLLPLGRAARRRRLLAPEPRSAVAPQGVAARRGLPPTARRGEDLRAGRRGVRSVGNAGDAGASTAYAFTLSFKGVFLEGLEVAFIVVTIGAAHDDYAAGDRRGRRRPRRGRDRRCDRSPAAEPGAREHDEARGRSDAHDVRDVLGCGGRGRALAGLRR